MFLSEPVFRNNFANVDVRKKLCHHIRPEKAIFGGSVFIERSSQKIAGKPNAAPEPERLLSEKNVNP